jgi:hypothetical protein
MKTILLCFLILTPSLIFGAYKGGRYVERRDTRRALVKLGSGHYDAATGDFVMVDLIAPLPTPSPLPDLDVLPKPGRLPVAAPTSATKSKRH